MMSFFRNPRPTRQSRGWPSPAGYDPRGGIPVGKRETAAHDQFPQSPLRYRWFGGGYRSEDVELVLAECRLAVRQLERRVAPLRQHERELEEELDALREELASLRTRQTELAGQVEAALAHAGKVEQLARDQSTWVMQLADHEPLPIDAAAMSARPVTELMRLNDELLTSAQTLDAQLKHADETLRAGAEEPEPAPEALAPTEEVPVEEAAALEPVAVEAPPPEPTPEAVVVPQPAPELRPAPAPPRQRLVPEVGALRDELNSLDLKRLQMPRPGYLAPLVLVIVAAGLATAVGLAVAGYSTAAVILLAAYALAIAALSVFGIGRPASVVSAPAAAQLPMQPEGVHEPEPQLAEAEWPAEDEVYEEPVPAFDPAEAHRELAELARERARRLVELGDAVEFGDENAANRARARLRELDALIAAKEAEIESAAAGNSNNGEGWHETAVSSNSQYDQL